MDRFLEALRDSAERRMPGCLDPLPSDECLKLWELWRRAQQMDVEQHPCVQLGDE